MVLFPDTEPIQNWYKKLKASSWKIGRGYFNSRYETYTDKIRNFKCKHNRNGRGDLNFKKMVDDLFPDTKPKKMKY